MEENSIPAASQPGTNPTAPVKISVNKRKFSLILFLVYLYFSSNIPFQFAHAQGDTVEKPVLQVTLTNLSTAQNKITGTLSIANLTQRTVYDAFYVIQVQSPGVISTETISGKEQTILNQGFLASYSQSNVFTLEKGKAATYPIELPYSPNIPSGSYSINVFSYNANGDMLGATTEKVSLTGASNYVQVDYDACQVVVDGVSFAQNAGPLVKNEQTALIQCPVTNTSLRALEIRPQLTYAVRYVMGLADTKAKETTLSQITQLAPGETKTVDVALPKIATPQVYEALLGFVDGNELALSPLFTFRWIVPGASANVQDARLDKTGYKKDEKAVVTTNTAPSMDLFWKGSTAQGPGFSPTNGTIIKNGIVEAIITDADGEVCGTGSVKLEQKNAYTKNTIPIAMRQDCEDPKVRVEVKDGEKTLASLTQQYASETSDTQVTKPDSTSSSFSFIAGIVGLVVLVSVIILGVLIRKGKIKFKMQKDNTKDDTNPPSGSSLTTLIVAFFAMGLLSAIVLWDAPLVLQKVFAERMYNNQRQSESWISATRYFGGGQVTNSEGQPIGENEGDSQGVRVNGWQNMTMTPSVLACSATPGIITLKVPYNIEKNYYTICGNQVISARARLIITVLIDDAVVDRSNIFVSNSGGFGSMSNPFSYSVASGEVVEIQVKTDGLDFSGGKKHKISVKTVAASDHTYSRYQERLVSFTTDNSETSEGVAFTMGENCDNADFRNTRCFGIVDKELVQQCGPTETPTPTPGPQCNSACTRAGDCIGDAVRDGCTACLPNATGTGKTCQKQACNSRCETRDDCATDAVRNGNNCTECVANASGVKTCQPAPTPTPTPILTCNTSCTNSAECQRGVDGCTTCIPNDTGTGSSCKPPPACGTSCKKDSQCAGARNGCTICGEAGKCTAFSADMCKCDGMDFAPAKGGTTFFPGDDVSFIAFGKVEGTNINVADLQSMTFSLYQSTLANPNKATRIAQSTAITPTIIQNDANKVRYKVTWNQKIPATVPSGSLFRVQAVIKCVAKPGVLGARTAASSNYYADVFATIRGLLSNTKIVLGETTRDQQQATSFFPGAKISEKSCSIIKFYFE